MKLLLLSYTCQALVLPPRRLAYDRGDEAALELWRCRRRQTNTPPD